jgi:hypothetical protein
MINKEDLFAVLAHEPTPKPSNRPEVSERWFIIKGATGKDMICREGTNDWQYMDEYKA